MPLAPCKCYSYCPYHNRSVSFGGLSGLITVVIKKIRKEEIEYVDDEWDAGFNAGIRCVISLLTEMEKETSL